MDEGKNSSAAPPAKKKKTAAKCTETASSSTNNFLKISEISATVSIRGKVTYTSGVRDWDSARSEGKKLCFDVADDSGTIRVFAWDEAAIRAGKIVKRDKIVEVRNTIVSPRKPKYNNLDHPFELTLSDTSEIVELKNFPVKVIEEETNFVPLKDVPKLDQDVHFAVTGKVTEVHSGESYRSSYWKDTFEIVDGEGNVLEVVSWNGEFPVTKNLVGKTVIINKCTYNHKHGINLTGAYITVNGHRVQ